MEAVCYTLEGALKIAIEREQHSIEIYQNALNTVKKPEAKLLLKELALEELGHKYVLEKALLKETIAHLEKGESTGPSMNLSYFLQEKPLGTSSTAQEIMIYAIHDKERAVELYKQMANQCKGAPMEKTFSELLQEEMIHLTKLEETYEKFYMSEM
jgi:rubrerythrin